LNIPPDVAAFSSRLLEIVGSLGVELGNSGGEKVKKYTFKTPTLNMA